jgi:hypothetical protein
MIYRHPISKTDLGSGKSCERCRLNCGDASCVIGWRGGFGYLCGAKAPYGTAGIPVGIYNEASESRGKQIGNTLLRR